MSFARFGTFASVLPKSGPVTYPQRLDFSALASQTIDMQPEITAGFIEYISGIYVDGRQLQTAMEITTGGINQSIGWPAGKQGYMPLLIGDNAQITFTVPAAVNGLIVPIQLVNTPVWPFMF